MSPRQISLYDVERACGGFLTRLGTRLVVKGVDVWFWAAERRAKRGRR